MSNNKKKKGGGGGQGGLRIADFVFDGSKASGAIEFRALQGSQGRMGICVEFFLGTATRRFAVRLTEAGGSPWTITTVAGGVGQREIDLSDAAFKDYTRLTIAPPAVAASAGGAGTPYTAVFEPVTIDLPSNEQVASKPVKAKAKRLQFTAPEGALKSRTNRFTLPLIRTYDKDGKLAAQNLMFRATGPITVKDSNASAVIASDKKVFNHTSPTSGLMFLEVEFAGFERTLTVIHLETGEEISLTMEFEY